MKSRESNTSNTLDNLDTLTNYIAQGGELEHIIIKHKKVQEFEVEKLKSIANTSLNKLKIIAAIAIGSLQYQINDTVKALMIINRSFSKCHNGSFIDVFTDYYEEEIQKNHAVHCKPCFERVVKFFFRCIGSNNPKYWKTEIRMLEAEANINLLHIVSKNEIDAIEPVKISNAIILLVQFIGYNVDYLSVSTYSALHYAAEVGNVTAIETLYEICPAININIQDQDGNTPLHLAAACGQAQAVEALLKLPGINLQIFNKKEGFAPLHLAAGNSKGNPVETVKAFLRYYESLTQEYAKLQVNIRDKDAVSNTPLHIAADATNFATIEVLLANSHIEINAKNNRYYKCSPLYYLVSKSLVEESDAELLKCVKLFLNHNKISDESVNDAFLNILVKYENMGKYKIKILKLFLDHEKTDLKQHGHKVLEIAASVERDDTSYVEAILGHNRSDEIQFSKCRALYRAIEYRDCNLNILSVLIKDGRLNINLIFKEDQYNKVFLYKALEVLRRNHNYDSDADYERKQNVNARRLKALGMALKIETLNINVMNGCDKKSLYAPIHAANTAAQLKLLLKHPNIDVNIKRTSDGNTALHKHLNDANKNIEQIKVLLQDQRVSLYERNYEGITPMRLMSRNVGLFFKINCSWAFKSAVFFELMKVGFNYMFIQSTFYLTAFAVCCIPFIILVAISANLSLLFDSVKVVEIEDKISMPYRYIFKPILNVLSLSWDYVSSNFEIFLDSKVEYILGLTPHSSRCIVYSDEICL